ncbi:sulfatase-like hydrolase/transferase [Roseibium sp.]|uniref:sulfatase-like hydrolase/transferase n=1 Tax=Roseibium sp. TaxID=1936156 RepID=UPI001B0D3B61|nr:sulfatase-like hydrolase/transferase [Roseibium sp.]MBO6855739.1 sulfatase-like hydrolase/transferase [Roseibium sp.]
MPVVQSLKNALEKRHLLSADTLTFAFGAILIPNAVFIFLSLFYCPFRTFFVLLLSLICLLGLYLHRSIFFVLLLAVMTVDVLVLISTFFQMPLPMLVDSLRYAGNLSLMNSAVYLAAAIVLLVSFALTYKVVVRTRQNRQTVNLAPFFVVLAIYAGIDWWANSLPQEYALAATSVEESYVPTDDAASLYSGLEDHLDDAQKRNVLVVMVEGLGAFASQELRDLIWQPLLERDVAEHYVVEQGDAVYFGSTTSGEVRELCNLKADYRDFRDRESGECLPLKAVKAGYRTAAFHAFTGNFFERFDWYPKIGFQDLFFMENKLGFGGDRTLPLCGIAFQGYCDEDAAEAVGKFLLEADGDRKFAYWLTLNSHKPVNPGEVPPRFSCDDGGGVFGDVELCRMAEQWVNVSHLVKAIALDESLAETEIVLVGDHHPPLFSRSARNKFAPGRVAWLHLKPKRDEQQTLAAKLSAGPADVQN